MKKKSLPVTNIGTVSLMMIFIVLSMVIFAALSLSSAASDARAGQKLQTHLEEYYNASNEAEELLARADFIFAEAGQKTADTEEFYRLVSEGTADFAASDLEDGRLILTYQVDINDGQALFVRLAVFSAQQAKSENLNSFYRILSWQVISTDTWEGDNTLKLIQ